MTEVNFSCCMDVSRNVSRHVGLGLNQMLYLDAFDISNKWCWAFMLFVASI